MKNILLSLFLMFGFIGVANADIFNPLPGKDRDMKLSASIPIVDSGSILSDASTIINYLGVKEGYVYNFQKKQFELTSGATIVSYTPWNLALDIQMLKTDGVAATISWNIGNYLPVNNVPIMRYFTYLYVVGGYGAEMDSNGIWQQAPVIGAEFKLAF